MSNEIRIEDLFLIYEIEGEKLVALRGLHLEISRGECLVIRGPNGSGKSTLVKLLTGYLTPTAGTIFLDGKNINEIDPIRLRREFVASVDQRGNLIEELTTVENLSLGHQLRNIGYKKSHSLSMETLEKFGLGEIANSYPRQISAGQRQIAALLTAIATKPKILIADEPSAELEDASAERVYSMLRELAGETTVILVTHDQRAEKFADRIVRIQEGRISEEWSPGSPELSVTDPFGWKRVTEISPNMPVRVRPHLDASALPFMRVEDLALEYPGRPLFSALNFTASAGQLIAIDSSNSAGSGKSSLLRVLAGISDPSLGNVRIGGSNMGELDRAARADLRNGFIGYLDQRSNSLENISLADFFGRLPIPQDHNFLKRRDQSLGTFSGGERAYIELNKILVEAKSILLLDEPTSQMDDRKTLDSIARIFECVYNGGIVVMITREKLILESADTVINLQRLHN